MSQNTADRVCITLPKTRIMDIIQNTKNILADLPAKVSLVAAVKTQSVEAVQEAIQGGVTIVGHNYIQEAQAMKPHVTGKTKWHFIGHLQTNKAKQAVELFDMIQTVDSTRLAKALNNQAQKMRKKIDVLIEINSGREPQKDGIMPENAINVIEQIAPWDFIRIKGLMTMGPWLDDPEDYRPYFKLTKELFEKIKKSDIPNVEMKYLSMGMTDSYKVAIEEGANMVRIGTSIFGTRR